MRKSSSFGRRWSTVSFAVIAAALLVTSALCVAGAAVAKPKSLSELLNQVRDGWKDDRIQNKKRVAEFRADRNQQAALLSQARARFSELEAASVEYEKAFTENEAKITKEEETLRLRLGTMGELFGVIRQVAGDAQAELKTSLVSAQFPGREKALVALATSKALPQVSELEALWFGLQQEMIEQGKVVKFKSTVTDANGEKAERDVIRVGVFNAVSDGKYLDWIPEVGALVELKPQPPERHLAGARELQSTYGTGEWATFGLDFTSGAILRALVQTPDLKERLSHGGVIGYLIIGLGLLTFAFGLVRFGQLSFTDIKVRKQRANLGQPKDDNPLGRILRLYAGTGPIDAKSLEHKLDEAVMKETARLESFLWAVRIVQIVAPLMGLLGTVTGMIRTFQSITLFGTGDPKRMAGGISEALVTTMLGLIVAISLVFLNSWLKTLSRRVTDILDQQSAGLVAQQAEREEQNAGLAPATA